MAEFMQNVLLPDNAPTQLLWRLLMMHHAQRITRIHGNLDMSKIVAKDRKSAWVIGIRNADGSSNVFQMANVVVEEEILLTIAPFLIQRKSLTTSLNILQTLTQESFVEWKARNLSQKIVHL